jgi:chemotaxis protein MotB
MRKERRHLGPALVASLLVHAAGASAILWPHPSDGVGTIEVELVELDDPSPAAPPAPAETARPSLMEPTPDAPDVTGLVAERDLLAARLESEATERARLDDQVAALRAETVALSAELADERRRTARREQALAAQIAADRAMHEQLMAALRREIADKDVALRQVREGLAVSIVDHVLFPSGRASLSPDGRAVIEKVARILTTGPLRRVIVEGHTDDVPIGPDLIARFPSNWELSAARATEVVRELVARRVPPHTLEAVGRADTRPAASNATETGRRQNRRIEIVLKNTRNDAGDTSTWEGQP